jgi:D-alanine-D-alanine ligase
VRAAGELVRELGLPLFVKPSNGGSSVGITRVAEDSEMQNALDLAFRHDNRAVVEQAVDGREIECAVLGAGQPEASVPGEIEPGAEFYTYDDKYKDGRARLLIPAPLDPEGSDAVRSAAVTAFRALGLRGMARVDFLLDRRDGRILFNEANTLPGFTPISMYSKLWEASGLSYPDLLDRLVSLAMEAPGSE